jgi:hypothetical protein
MPLRVAPDEVSRSYLLAFGKLYAGLLRNRQLRFTHENAVTAAGILTILIAWYDRTSVPQAVAMTEQVCLKQ